MEIGRYFELIVDPTIADFEAHPTSIRHAFLASVAVFHSIDYLFENSHAKRGELCRQSPDFANVDRIAHAFKHVETGNENDRFRPPLTAEGVISRPPFYYNVSGAFGLSRWNDGVGGVTLDNDRVQDVLSIVKGAAAFIRNQPGDLGRA
jgi:hypothetical protein